MAHRESTLQGRPAGPFFKSDYPREIDRYIDYFGGRGPAALDPCGEVFLDRLGDEEETA